MITELFYWTLNMSAAGTAVGLLVLLLRRIRRLSRRTICLLWLLPLVRLCVPFGLPSRYSLLTLLGRFTTRSVPVGTVPELTYTNFLMAANSYGTSGGEFAFKNPTLETVFLVGGAIWSIVFVASILTLAVFYFLTKAELRGAAPLEGNLYISDKVTSPALYGILKPRIVLPPGIPMDALVFVTEHEEAHRRRGDNVWRLIAIAAACLHWFNPFAWIFLKCYLEDAELACDEAVLRKLGAENRTSYARALLSCQESRTLFAPAFTAVFGGARLKIRIEKILSYRKLTAAGAGASLLLLAALAAALLTNAG